MPEGQASPGSLKPDSKGSLSPLSPPPPNTDLDWRERIEIAKRIREETKKARSSRPSTFNVGGPPIRFRR